MGVSENEDDALAVGRCVGDSSDDGVHGRFDIGRSTTSVGEVVFVPVEHLHNFITVTRSHVPRISSLGDSAAIAELPSSNTHTNIGTRVGLGAGASESEGTSPLLENGQDTTETIGPGVEGATHGRSTVNEDVNIEVGDVVVSVVAACTISPLTLFVSHTVATRLGLEAALGDADTSRSFTLRDLLSISQGGVPFTFGITSVTNSSTLVARAEGVNTSSRGNTSIPLAHGIFSTSFDVFVTNAPFFNTSVGRTSLVDRAESVEFTTTLFTSRRGEIVDGLALVFTALVGGTASIPNTLVVGSAGRFSFDFTILFTATRRRHDGVPNTVIRIVVAVGLSGVLDAVADTAEGRIFGEIPSTLIVGFASSFRPVARADNLAASAQSGVPDTSVFVVAGSGSTEGLAVRFTALVGGPKAGRVSITSLLSGVGRARVSTSSGGDDNVGPATLGFVTHVFELGSEFDTVVGFLDGVPAVGGESRQTSRALIETVEALGIARIDNRSTRDKDGGVTADVGDVAADVVSVVEGGSTSSVQDDALARTVSTISLIDHVVGHDERRANVDTISVVDVINTSVDAFIPVDFLLEFIKVTSVRITQVVARRIVVVGSTSLLVVGNPGRTSPHEGGEAETRILLGNTTSEVPGRLSQSEARQPAADGFDIIDSTATLGSSSNLEGEENIHGRAESHVVLDTSTNFLGVGVDERTIPEAVGVSSAGTRSGPARATTFVATVDTITSFPEAERIFVAGRSRSVSVEAEADITGTRVLRVKIPTTLSIVTAFGDGVQTEALVINALVFEGRPRTLRVGITPRAVVVEGAASTESSLTTIGEVGSSTDTTVFTSVTV